MGNLPYNVKLKEGKKIALVRIRILEIIRKKEEEYIKAT